MIYIPIPRTASNSFRTAFAPAIRCPAPVGADGHPTLGVLTRRYPGDRLALSIIRDPLDRAISFFYWISRPREDWEPFQGHRAAKTLALRQFARHAAQCARNPSAFFSDMEPETLAALSWFLPPMQKQTYFLDTETSCSLILCRFDRLQDDLERITADHIHGAVWEDCVRRFPQAYRQKVSPRHAGPIELTEKARGVIETHFREDVELWNALDRLDGPFVGSSVSELLEG